MEFHRFQCPQQRIPQTQLKDHNDWDKKIKTFQLASHNQIPIKSSLITKGFKTQAKFHGYVESVFRVIFRSDSDQRHSSSLLAAQMPIKITNKTSLFSWKNIDRSFFFGLSVPLYVCLFPGTTILRCQQKDQEWHEMFNAWSLKATWCEIWLNYESPQLIPNWHWAV